MIAMQSDSTQQSPDRKWVLPFATTLFAMVALQMSSLGFAPLLPEIQKQFSMSYAQVGLFTGIYGLIGIALSVPAGLMAKRFGEKWVLIGGLVVLALGLGLLSRAAGFGGALIGRGVWIGGYRFAFVCVLTALALTCPPSLRGRLMGIVGAMSSLASVIGAPFGSSIAQKFGWRIAILAFAYSALLAAAVVAVFYVNIPSAMEPAASRLAAEDRKAAPSAFRVPAVWGLALLGGLIGMPSFSVTFFVPSAATSVFKLDPVSASWIISSGYLTAIFLNLFVGYLMDKFNKWIVMGTLMALLVPTCFAVTIDNLLVFRIGIALILAIGFTATNQLYGIAGDVLRGRQSGNVMGVISLGAGVCGYLGPQMLGVLRDRTGGFAAGWHAIAGVAAATVCGIFLLNRYGRAGMREAEDTLETSRA
jgi:NNP family nitrate/nitrite transporter-like MFS transporter